MEMHGRSVESRRGALCIGISRFRTAPHSDHEARRPAVGGKTLAKRRMTKRILGARFPENPLSLPLAEKSLISNWISLTGEEEV